MFSVFVVYEQSVAEAVPLFVTLTSQKTSFSIRIESERDDGFNADKIVVLENGKLIEEGTHNELYQQKTTYFQMWQRQFPILLDQNKLISHKPA